MRFLKELFDRIGSTVHFLWHWVSERISDAAFAVSVPFRWLIDNWAHRRIRDFLLGLPAILALAAVATALGASRVHSQTLTSEYVDAAKAAITAKDYKRAHMLLTRVIDRRGSQLTEAQFLMAVLLDEVGQDGRASALFELLAPDDRPGNRDAHRRLAMILAESVTSESPPEQVKRLLWHLTNSRDESTAEMSLAWGRYFLAVGDADNARKYLTVAVKAFPELWQTLGVIEAALGNTSSAIGHFQRSTAYLSEQLRQDPRNEPVRVDYAQVLMKLGRLDEARLVLEEGKLLNEKGNWSWLLASLTVAYHDLHATEGRPLAELLGYLDRALSYDPNHGPALNRLMSYSKAKVNGNVELRTVLARVIAEGHQPALAHLAMGNLCWIEEDRDGAIFHFEQAMELRKDAGMLLNNLAWIVAHDEQAPDYERSLQLINTALSEDPENPSYLDTRGTVYFLQKEWRKALPDLEKSLAGVRNPQDVHRKLALIYRELKMPEIAAEHDRLSESPEAETQEVVP